MKSAEMNQQAMKEKGSDSLYESDGAKDCSE